MHITQRCPCCTTTFDLMWEDNDDAYTLAVDEVDLDYSDSDDETIPKFCPFCGEDTE
jgi:hypothetical protein